MQLADDSDIRIGFMGANYIRSNSTFSIIDSLGGITDNGVTLDFGTNSATTSLVLDPGFMNNDQDYFVIFQRAVFFGPKPSAVRSCEKSGVVPVHDGMYSRL